MTTYQKRQRRARRCPNDGAKPKRGRIYCQRCTEASRERMRRYRARLKEGDIG